MKKSKIFLISLTIFMLAANSFKSIAMAAQVAWVNESKGRIHINGGMNDGFLPGATACFFISSASFGDELVCGTVQSASGSIAVVKIPKSKAKKMRKGTQAMPLVYVEKEDEKEMKKKENKEEIKENISSGPMGIHDEVWFR